MDIEKRIDVGLDAAGISSEGLDEALGGMGVVSEQVREIAGEKGGTEQKYDAKPVQTRKQSSLWGKISGLLGGHEPAVVKLPSVDVQRVHLEKSIRKETRRLVKKARKIQAQKNFSASALEKVVGEIRYLQGLLKEVLHALKDRVEALYRQFVLR